MKHFSRFLLLIIFSALASCNNDDGDNKPQDNGLSKEINELVPAGLLQELKKLGMPIHTGSNPPDIQLEFYCSPFTLIKTNVKNDTYAPGDVFADYYGTFYEQNNEALTIKVDYKNGPESGTGIGSFIAGEGNNFSVFAEIHGEAEGDKARLIQVISGTVTAKGIKDLYVSNFMLEGGDESDYWIDNGEGRILSDKDKLSEITD